MQTYQEKIGKTEYRSVQKCCSIWRTKINDPSYYKNIGAIIIETQLNGKSNGKSGIEYNIFCQKNEMVNFLKMCVDDLAHKYIVSEVKLFNGDNRIRFVRSNNFDIFEFFKLCNADFLNYTTNVANVSNVALNVALS